MPVAHTPARYVEVVVLLGLAGGGLTLAAQPQQTFRTATRVVEVAVVVTDRNGKSVRGLTQSDFTLTEDGEVQPISFFDVRGAGAAATAPAPSRHFRPPSGPSAFANVMAIRVG